MGQTAFITTWYPVPARDDFTNVVATGLWPVRPQRGVSHNETGPQGRGYSASPVQLADVSRENALISRTGAGR